MRLNCGDSWWLWLDTTFDQLYDTKEQKDGLQSLTESSGNVEGPF